MPWTEIGVMEERARFLVAYESGQETLSELCREFGISRKTGYKWIARFEAQGVAGLADRPRSPQHCPHAVDAKRQAKILELREGHKKWGPVKLKARLERRYPRTLWPAASTIGELLKRWGRVRPRGRRSRATPSAGLLRDSACPNALWTVDFKGWLRLGNGLRCTPLTISDHFSRYLLCCQGLMGPTGYAQVRPLMEAVFCRHGLPEAIRSDNGTPFASVGLGGLSRLSVWWMKLGIRLERIEPGQPQQNGRHERMHRTLNEETASPPAYSAPPQQRRFDAFEREFNEERPHEALGGDCPSAHYGDSPRTYPRPLLDLADHPHGWLARKVKASGYIKWEGRELRVTEALGGEIVGMQPTADGRWRLHFGPLPLGIFDERTWRIRREEQE